MTHFSDHIIFVDESGDHGLTTIDTNYPIFVLAFCIFKKDVYATQVVPQIQQFKFRHFGHDQVILHETDIRKDRGAFSHLKSAALKQSFMQELTTIVENANFSLVATAIRKEAYRARYRDPANPYHIALQYGLERAYYYLREQNEIQRKTHVIVERRGKKEDDELELEFLRICNGANYLGQSLPFEIHFADKKSNSAGLQLADIIARPIGINLLRPDQPNRAYEIIRNKFYRNGNGRIEGWGLKCFP